GRLRQRAHEQRVRVAVAVGAVEARALHGAVPYSGGARQAAAKGRNTERGGGAPLDGVDGGGRGGAVVDGSPIVLRVVAIEGAVRHEHGPVRRRRVIVDRAAVVPGFVGDEQAVGRLQLAGAEHRAAVPVVVRAEPDGRIAFERRAD